MSWFKDQDAFIKHMKARIKADETKIEALPRSTADSKVLQDMVSLDVDKDVLIQELTRMNEALSDAYFNKVNEFAKLELKYLKAMNKKSFKEKMEAGLITMEG